MDEGQAKVKYLVYIGTPCTMLVKWRKLAEHFLASSEIGCMHEVLFERFGERALLRSGLPLGNGLRW